MSWSDNKELSSDVDVINWNSLKKNYKISQLMVKLGWKLVCHVGPIDLVCWPNWFGVLTNNQVLLWTFLPTKKKKVLLWRQAKGINTGTIE